MNKTSKYKLIITFCSLLIVAIFSLLFINIKNHVSADEILSDKNFKFETGMSINGSSSDNSKVMRVGLQVTNTDLFEKYKNSYFTYKFTLNRVDTNNKLVPLKQITIKSKYLYGTYGNRNLTYNKMKKQTINDTGSDLILDSNCFSESDGLKLYKNKIYLYIDLDSYLLNYQITFNYDIYKQIHCDFILTTYNNQEGTISSSTRSYKQILQTMDSLGVLEDELSGTVLDEAKEILAIKQTTSVKVNYLENVTGTPFAKKNTKVFQLEVLNNMISREDLANALNIKTLDILQSVCTGFNYDSENECYTAVYSKSVWLSAKTTDGNSFNYFLDCNKNYYEYYHSFVNDGVFSNDLYEYIFYQKIIKQYSQLALLTPNDVYGYFGYVVIPNTYTFNTAMKEMFDTKTTFKGIVNGFEYDDLISFSSYDKLLKNYNYSWLQRAWGGIAGFVSGGTWSASHYLIFADATTNESFIGENGAHDQDDNNGVIGGIIDDTVDKVGDFFEGIWNGIKSAKNYVYGLVVLGFAVVIIVAVIKYKNKK